MTEIRRLRKEIPTDEALELLTGISLGRIVYTSRALPAIQPVNHIIDDSAIIIRTYDAAIIAIATHDGVVAYEATQSTPTSISAGASPSPASPTYSPTPAKSPATARWPTRGIPTK